MTRMGKVNYLPLFVRYRFLQVAAIPRGIRPSVAPKACCQVSGCPRIAVRQIIDKIEHAPSNPYLFVFSSTLASLSATTFLGDTREFFPARSWICDESQRHPRLASSTSEGRHPERLSDDEQRSVSSGSVFLGNERVGCCSGLAACSRYRYSCRTCCISIRQKQSKVTLPHWKSCGGGRHAAATACRGSELVQWHLAYRRLYRFQGIVHI